VRDDCIEVLNLMSSRDLYQNPFAEITKYCKIYSRSQSKTGKSVRDPTNRIVKPTPGGVTRIELGNLLEKFKTDILNTISSQLDTIKIKMKQELENVALAILCHRCRRKHPEKEFPLNVIKMCGLCIEDHPTNECPYLPRLKSIFKVGGEPHETSYPPKRPWRQKNPQYVFRPYYTIFPTTMGTSHVLPSMVTTTATNPTLATRMEKNCIWEFYLSANNFSHLPTIPFKYFSVALRI
jgi:hypothetical protein